MTYLLDTNVISELRKLGDGRADPNVVRWFEAHRSAQFFVSVITIIEIERGILGVLRRDEKQGAMLRIWMDNHVRPQFADRILAIDDAVATRCAGLHVPDRRSEADALIAATALVHNLSIVTRNISDFDGTGVVVINPWNAVF
ncbi:type II toxin-antitoxin system VapC family toxin [Rhizobium sp. L1K21]|uniref:type II toxin-antitoxin system VapC family toxin n=1 Tax=Rhizobium sp. L1K21 TaxID=2954933 RepID=UPI002092A881|nr:type II toxin-antitoxin system VapC family toxin [Rhizobium sp. L1K21]MCO6188279.1 type II toxin-antitoxin system VapC family toxin [Rhizobium sp. L1K21]